MAASSNPMKRDHATASLVESVDNKRTRTSPDESDIYNDFTATSVATTDSSAATTARSSTSSLAIEDTTQLISTATLPKGLRPVFAFSRQDLCECSEEFKSHQSGTYTKDRNVKSLLIDNRTEPRDTVGPYYILTTVGGCREQYTGKMVKGAQEGHTTRSDQKPSNVKFYEMSIGHVVIVIMGSKHPQFKDLDFGTLVPRDARYVELGAFRIIDVWKEFVQPEGVQSPYPVWRVKLHTLRQDLLPWYWPKHHEVAATVPEKALEPCLRHVCNTCGQSSLKVFDNAPWVCLQAECEQSFKFAGKLLDQTGDDGNDLRHSQSFLDMAEPSQGEMEDLPHDLPQMFQPPSVALDENGTLWGTEKKLRGGFVCPDCGCGNSQVFWDRKECRNCPFRQDAILLPYPMDQIRQETRDDIKKNQKRHGLTDGVTIKVDQHHVDIFIETMENGTKLFIYFVLNVEGNCLGTSVLERPDDASMEALCGANKLLEGIQNEGSGIPLERHPARCPDTSSETKTRHFQSNFGVQYDFGVKPIPSIPFEGAPDVILKSLALLTDAGKRALQYSQELAQKHGYTFVDGSTLMEPYEPYNELLALAYRETDSIGWHDDGENQVKGIISTASLGSPGTMGLRLKGDKKAKPILELHVCHGDIVTMCDTRLQAFTEHKVESEGVRRYAVTSRAIDINYYKDPKMASKLSKLGTSVEQLEASGRLPERARHFSHGNTTLGDDMPDAQDSVSG